MRTFRTLSLVGVACLLSGCAGAFAPDESQQQHAQTSPGPTVAAPLIAPLTGEVVAEPIVTPAVMAKIDNQIDALPQTGLEAADIVFEELVEGGITRYVGVWHSDVPELIGPVRSIRPMDPAIAAPFGGAIVYSGGQDRFITAMQATDVENVVHGEGHDAYFERDLARAAPHNVYVHAATLRDEQLIDLDAPVQPWDFSDVPSAGQGSAAAELTVTFSETQSATWSCDADGLWWRSQHGRPDMSSVGEQLHAHNVLVLDVNVVDDQDVPFTQLVDRSGSGVVQSGCASIPVQWSKGSAADPFVLETLDGAPVSLAVGTTWVALVPQSGSFEVTE